MLQLLCDPGLDHRGESVGLDLLGIPSVADSDECLFQKADDRRQHPREAVLPASMSAATRSRSASKAAAKLDDMFVLVLIAQLSPFGMVSILFALTRIETCRLYMSVGLGTDPDGFESRVDTYRLDAPTTAASIMCLPSLS